MQSRKQVRLSTFERPKQEEIPPQRRPGPSRTSPPHPRRTRPWLLHKLQVRKQKAFYCHGSLARRACDFGNLLDCLAFLAARQVAMSWYKDMPSSSIEPSTKPLNSAS